jgi:OOP family OmpA-OmpF porin
MKKLIVTSSTLLIMNGFAYAGGDILPTVFETEEVVVPIEEYVVPIEEYLPVVKVLTPVSTPKVIPVPVVIKDILPLGLYVALGLTAARYDPNCNCPLKGKTDKTAGVIGRIGYDFNPFFGVEARAIKTKWLSAGGDIEHYGVFFKPMYPISNDINIYGLAGYAKTETPGVTRRKTDTKALAWGLGLEYDLGTDTPKEGRYSRTFDGYGDQEAGWGLFADYERLVQKSGSPDFDTANIGVTYDF